jgi:hypothetical protein
VGEKRLGSGERREENEWTGARALPVRKEDIFVPSLTCSKISEPA